ncbi:L-2-aminoadipate reductase large subunit [Dissostichus eleginoides]|uniref:L-2-aminoadipate reductase large subunit n=1 Tax=Dissostichus eleginoides TaxID=100907 RepID=A0AAD9C419_DISEL|nr:L-2-aminoadipate reductase large subunit [Dissostichus eleginoides]
MYITDVNLRLLHFSTLKSQAGQVTELLVDFIKQLRANFTSRFEDYSIPKDIIAFVRDPLTVRPSGDFTSQAKQMIPSLDEAALEMELIDFQTSSLVSDALRSAESRNRLTHKNLENCLRIKVTSISPDIQKIATDGRCQFSH